MSDYDYSKLNVTIESNVCRLTIDRADTLNALDVSTVDELIDTVKKLSDDDAVTVVVLETAGDRAFSAGSDVSAFAAETLPEHVQKNESLRELYAAIDSAAQPFIAEVDGAAYGSGAELALACDIRLASSDAVFCMAEISLGLIPPTGRLMRAVGEQAARELCYTGREVEADEALDLGLYLDVVEPDALNTRTEELAEQIADKPRTSVTLTKRNLNLSRDKPTEDTLAHNLYSFALAFTDDDVQAQIESHVDNHS